MFEELDEEPLRPAVIFRVSADRFPPPIKHGAHAFELRFAFVRCWRMSSLGMDISFDGRIFSRKAKASKPIGNSTLYPLHSFITGAGVGGGHGIPVPNMKITGRIGQHGQGIIFGFVLGRYQN